MSTDPMRQIRMAARSEHRKLSATPRRLAVTPLGRIRRASKCNTMRHVVMGRYDKSVPLSVFVEDAEAAFAELLGEA